MINLYLPGDDRQEERIYIYSLLLKEFLGLELTTIIQPADQDHVIKVTAPGLSSPTLEFPDIFFSIPAENWLSQKSLPALPLPSWRATGDLPEAELVDPTLPVIYGRPLANDAWFSQHPGGIRLGLDIAGSAFFMLTRYEELVQSERDVHYRFPASSSLAVQAGFLHRPIVNEYLEVLWACLKRLWPSLERRSRQYEVRLSHDVDRPASSLCLPRGSFLRLVLADALKRGDLPAALRRVRSAMGDLDADPDNTFDFIMDCSEARGLKCAFYFMPEKGPGKYDGTYRLDHPWIQGLLKRIHARRHEIGIHPVGEAYCQPAILADQAQRLREALELNGIGACELHGGRQHYLRWRNPVTWQAWEDAGLSYDSTLSYAQQAGFRAGICYPYPVFNLLERKPLRLVEYPLVVMEGTLLDQQYEGLTPPKALERIASLARTVRRFEGCFTLLWHNSSLALKNDKRLFLQILEVVQPSPIGFKV